MRAIEPCQGTRPDDRGLVVRASVFGAEGLGSSGGLGLLLHDDGRDETGLQLENPIVMLARGAIRAEEWTMCPKVCLTQESIVGQRSHSI